MKDVTFKIVQTTAQVTVYALTAYVNAKRTLKAKIVQIKNANLIVLVTECVIS